MTLQTSLGAPRLSAFKQRQNVLALTQNLRHWSRLARMPCKCQQEAFTVVGKGRVGTAIAEMGTQDVLIGRGEEIRESSAGPVIVCTRNDDLNGVIEAMPSGRRKDLVFIQNGMLQPWLDEKGLSNSTQVLVYFAVAKKGEKPQDGKTDKNPEGLTAAWGPHAETVARRLHDNGLSCGLPDKDAFKQAMLEKLIWICAYMVVGARHKATVGEVEQKHKDEVTLLIEELGNGGAQALSISMADGYIDRLHAYSRSVAHFPTAVKEFKWRNGWFYSHTKAAQAEGNPDPYPTHTKWLAELSAI